jgi:hypothetical protein
MVLFDFSSALPPASHVGLVPFELFREPMIVLGIADADEYLDWSNESRRKEFAGKVTHLRDKYTRTLIHQVLIFDDPGVDSELTTDGVVQIAPLGSVKRVCSNLALQFLDEVASYAKSILPLPSIPSPSVPQDQMIQAQWSDDGSRSSNGSRSSTPDPKELHRMSMPALGRESPNRPARTFEEMNQNARSDTPKSKLRPGSAIVSRDASQDRVSVSGFGSDSFTEKARKKGQGRVGVVLASVFMQAGRWHDALRESIESGNKARAQGDHIWHAKALEIIALCMILLAWSGFEFSIPQICYPSTEKHVKEEEVPPLEISTFSSPAAQSTLLKMLTNLIPSMTNTIMNIYARTSVSSGDVIPQIVYSEFGIRMASLMGTIYRAGGNLTTSCISHAVLGTPLSNMSDVKPRVFPSRREIGLLLAKSHPPPNDQSGLSAPDRIIILAGIISVFSSLDMHRKKAMVLKELIETLTPILRQLRVQDAAEAGVHPWSGSLGRVDGFDDEKGLEGLLSAICHVYGVPEFGLDSARDVPDLVGSVEIKIEILRTCIRICEAMFDYRGILHYSSALLRAAGPGIAQNDTGDIQVSLSSEEQLQLSSTIQRTVTEAKASGFDVDAEYWDDFLVRGLYVLDPPKAHVFAPNRKSELKTETGPFIHNPFATKTTEAWPNLLAVDEDREFVVSLQNPFEFEVAIEHIKLSADGDIDISSHSLILKPYRTQNFSLVGKIAQDGPLSINGCIIKIQGCRERLFPIFSQPWIPTRNVKVKTVGFVRSGHNHADSSIPSQDESPVPNPLQLTVIPPQPNLGITSTSVSHNALMLLEGEQATFDVTLTNSSSVAVDFLHVTFFDSATAAINDALNQKGLAPGDLYEIEYQLLHLPAIRLIEDQPTVVKAHSSATFHFQLLAKPGLTSVNIQFNYGNISQPHLKGKDTIFTRQLVLPISVTVNASIQIHRLDILPLSSDFQWPQAETRFDSVFGPVESDTEFCLLLFDVRNSWPSPLHCEIQATYSLQSQPKTSQTYEPINPGQSIRQILAIPRMYIPNPHAPIKPISPGRQRQFVVSSDRITPENERNLREMFWFREGLLDLLKGSWKMEGKMGQRFGNIDLRAIRFNTRMVEVMKLPDISVAYNVIGKHAKKQAGSFEVQVDDFATLQTTLYNRSNRTIMPLLRLRPSLADQPRDIALDMGKRFAWSGVLQQVLPKLAPQQSCSVELPICALCAGDFEVGATVEEVLSLESSISKEPVLDDLVADTHRRTWTAEETCRIVAVEVDE